MPLVAQLLLHQLAAQPVVVLHQLLVQLVPLVHQLVAAVAQPVAVLPDGSEATALVQPTFCCTCSYLSPFIPFLILINWDSVQPTCLSVVRRDKFLWY